MAKFIGTAGDFQKEKAINRRLNALMGLFGGFTVIVFVLGYVAGRRSLWWSLIAFSLMYPAFKLLERLFDKQIRMVRSEEEGASGEKEIVTYLKALPDTYTVISDLDFAGSYGNIDHLIIGPTGVFAVDVKNWRGTVTADGKGELLHNGRATDKPHVRAFTRRAMDMKDRLTALTKLDPYIQCVFVFPRTHIEAKWGSTGAVHCIHADQIESYITKGHGGKQLPTADIPRLVSAVEALRNLAPKASVKNGARTDDRGNAS